MAKKPRIVYTSGSWDMFHLGHLNMLKQSKQLGDVLIAGVSTDELIIDYKGIAPIIPYEQRVAIVDAIDCVDRVVKQSILTEIRQLQELEVDVVTIGDDWQGKHLDGLEWMESQPGKEIVYFPYTPGISTTDIKRKIIKSSYEIITAELQREVDRMEEWKRQQANLD